MLLADFIRGSVAALAPLYPVEEARSIIHLLCEERLGTRSYTHIVDPGYEVPAHRQAELDDAVARLGRGEPVQYVLGYTDFCGHRFQVNRSVLIPRPETEELVREAVVRALRLDRPARVLDLCTGSGCIAWSVLLDVPDAEVVAVDVSADALDLARTQFPGRAPLFLQADVLDTAQDFPYGPFDLILANPPYIRESEKARMRPNVLDYEPPLALFVPDGDALLFYRAIARWARRFLRPDGTGIVEINEDLAPQTAAVFREAGFRHVHQLDDFSGKPRFVLFSEFNHNEP